MQEEKATDREEQSAKESSGSSGYGAEQERALLGRYVGERLAGRYRMLRLIGQGSLCIVLLGRDEHESRDCAIKLVRPGHGHARELTERLRIEGQILASLSHPHVVKLYDLIEDVAAGEAERAPALILELIEGEPLDRLVIREGTLSVRAATALALQIGGALATAHMAQIIHRDVKPQNILIPPRWTESPEQAGARLIDFGLARQVALKRRHDASNGMLIGTPEYLPPEALRGYSRGLDGRLDQWSLAVVLYRALSGRLPFQRTGSLLDLIEQIERAPPPPLSALRPDAPPHICSVIGRALAKRPADRFPSMQAFLRALERLPDLGSLEMLRAHTSTPSLLTGRPAAAVDPAPRQEPARELPFRGLWRSRRTRAAMGAGVLAGGLLCAIVSSWIAPAGSPSRAPNHADLAPSPPRPGPPPGALITLAQTERTAREPPSESRATPPDPAAPPVRQSAVAKKKQKAQRKKPRRSAGRSALPDGAPR